MAGMTKYLANKLLDHTLRPGVSGSVFPQFSSLTLSLHRSDPGDTGGWDEIDSGTTYQRQPIIFSASSDGFISNSSSPTFIMPSSTVRYFAIWGVTGATSVCLFVGSVGGSAGIPFNHADTYQPQPGALTVSRDLA